MDDSYAKRQLFFVNVGRSEIHPFALFCSMLMFRGNVTVVKKKKQVFIYVFLTFFLNLRFNGKFVFSIISYTSCLFCFRFNSTGY